MSPSPSGLTPNPRKTRSVRPLGPVDITALTAALEATDEADWALENAAKPNRFRVLDAASHIVFRFIDSPLDWRSAHDRPAWPKWRDLLQPVLEQIAGAYGYARPAFPRVMLARLPAGGVIEPHVDANPAALWPHKVHVPLKTNPGVIAFFGGEEHVFPVGQAVEVDNLGPHFVRNTGETERVHLIFEIYDRDQPDPRWLGPLVAAGVRR